MDPQAGEAWGSTHPPHSLRDERRYKRPSQGGVVRIWGELLVQSRVVPSRPDRARAVLSDPSGLSGPGMGEFQAVPLCWVWGPGIAVCIVDGAVRGWLDRCGSVRLLFFFFL